MATAFSAQICLIKQPPLRACMHACIRASRFTLQPEIGDRAGGGGKGGKGKRLMASEIKPMFAVAKELEMERPDWDVG